MLNWEVRLAGVLGVEVGISWKIFKSHVKVFTFFISNGGNKVLGNRITQPGH